MKNKSVLKGGKFLARGTYGCVYGPNLPGAKYIREDKYISKIVERSDFKAEFTEVATLGIPKIDPEAKYTIYPLDADTITDYDLNNENDFLECSIVTNIFNKLNSTIPKAAKVSALNKFFVNIIQPNGGLSIEKYLTSKFKQDPSKPNVIAYQPSLLSADLFNSLLVKMTNAFKGLLLFNVNGISHRDIKTPNITMEPNMRLIDFGLSTSETNFNTKVHKEMSGSDYPIWPLDYNILNDINKLPKTVAERAKYIADLYDKAYEPYLEYHTITYVGKEAKKQIVDKTVAFIEEFIADFQAKKDTKIHYKQCLLSIDTYSLSLVLLNITMLIERGVRALYPPPADPMYIKYKKLLDDMNVIGLMMIQGNPHKRPSMADSAGEYISTLAKHGLITKEQMEKDMEEIDIIVKTKKAPKSDIVNAIVEAPTPKPVIAKVPTPKPVVAKVPTPKPAIAKVPTPKEIDKIDKCYNSFTMIQLKDILSKNKIEGRSKLTNKTAACEVLVKLGLV